MSARVARFLLTQYTKTVKSLTKLSAPLPIYHKVYKRLKNIPKYHKNIPTFFILRPFKKLPKLGFFGLKIYNMATLMSAVVTVMGRVPLAFVT
jgi:hypothetical protein